MSRKLVLILEANRSPSEADLSGLTAHPCSKIGNCRFYQTHCIQEMEGHFPSILYVLKKYILNVAIPFIVTVSGRIMVHEIHPLNTIEGGLLSAKTLFGIFTLSS